LPKKDKVMQAESKVQIDSFRNINKIPNAWTNKDYLALMTIMDLDDGLDEMN
jgi:hypothetical protein